MHEGEGAIGWIECGWSNCRDLDRENILSMDVRVTPFVVIIFVSLPQMRIET